MISSPGVTYNEDNYVDVQPLSSQNVPSWTQMRSSPQPPQSTTPSNVSSPVPWQSPPSGKMNSPHNGRNSNLPPLDHSKRGPMQLPTQKLDFRNKVLSRTCIVLTIKSIKNLNWQCYLHIQQLHFHLKFTNLVIFS